MKSAEDFDAVPKFSCSLNDLFKFWISPWDGYVWLAIPRWKLKFAIIVCYFWKFRLQIRIASRFQIWKLNKIKCPISPIFIGFVSFRRLNLPNNAKMLLFISIYQYLIFFNWFSLETRIFPALKKFALRIF